MSRQPDLQNACIDGCIASSGSPFASPMHSLVRRSVESKEAGGKAGREKRVSRSARMLFARADEQASERRLWTHGLRTFAAKCVHETRQQPLVQAAAAPPPPYPQEPIKAELGSCLNPGQPTGARPAMYYIGYGCDLESERELAFSLSKAAQPLDAMLLLQLIGQAQVCNSRSPDDSVTACPPLLEVGLEARLNLRDLSVGDSLDNWLLVWITRAWLEKAGEEEEEEEEDEEEEDEEEYQGK
ncbi:unnamed protein product [Schistocephalus solidus]|uniref:Uncharacterized protein n=1 Tax=Schistocephalus solidus TaxID=70667 RepID=A0A183T6H1_SCHSO|nr:unnamed protein product [Schistocephalus solidus]